MFTLRFYLKTHLRKQANAYEGKSKVPLAASTSSEVLTNLKLVSLRKTFLYCERTRKRRYYFSRNWKPLAWTSFLFPTPTKNWIKTFTFTNTSFFSTTTIKSQRFLLLKQIILSKKVSFHLMLPLIFQIIQCTWSASILVTTMNITTHKAVIFVPLPAGKLATYEILSRI